MEIIKRYTNRKLYSDTLKRYVSLSDLEEMTLNDKPYIVQCYKTNENLTKAIQARILSRAYKLNTLEYTRNLLEKMRVYFN